MARLVAGSGAALATTARLQDRGVRVGVDGAVDADAATLTDAVASHLRGQGLPVLCGSRDRFLRPRSLRLEYGEDPLAPWERWYDDDGLRRELLDPLGPGGSRMAAVSLWNAVSDRATREPRRLRPAGTVAIVNGPFLLRWELADAFDLVVHLETSAAAMSRRGSLLAVSWAHYIGEVDPALRATVLVRHEDPRHPAVVRT